MRLAPAGTLDEPAGECPGWQVPGRPAVAVQRGEVLLAAGDPPGCFRRADGRGD